jgi:hypothetical protein
MKKPLTHEQHRFLLACEVTKWKLRLAHVEEHGGVEPIDAVTMYQLFVDQAKLHAGWAERVVHEV